ncbi:ras-related protein Rab-26 isoform X1 [Pelodiscus sinensis]|uniref:ras-related protein Rab-26 isoform X1 n=1 Tax=Pelodiscus sinensis TaxID=13735 RepID=UPI003F6BCF89
MSRKKTLKSKGSGSASPSSALPPKENGQAGGARAKGGGSRPSPELPLNGVVLPSRPSLSSSGEFYDVAFKVMLVGDSGVGKTCLLVRFKDGAFLAGSFISTVGIDFRNKVLNVDGVKVKLQIWDTAGQERFRSVTHAYYRDAHALLLLYDVTNRASFDNIQREKPIRRTSAPCCSVQTLFPVYQRAISAGSSPGQSSTVGCGNLTDQRSAACDLCLLLARVLWFRHWKCYLVALKFHLESKGSKVTGDLPGMKGCTVRPRGLKCHINSPDPSHSERFTLAWKSCRCAVQRGRSEKAQVW